MWMAQKKKISMIQKIENIMRHMPLGTECGDEIRIFRFRRTDNHVTKMPTRTFRKAIKKLKRNSNCFGQDNAQDGRLVN